MPWTKEIAYYNDLKLWCDDLKKTSLEDLYKNTNPKLMSSNDLTDPLYLAISNLLHKIIQNNHDLQHQIRETHKKNIHEEKIYKEEEERESHTLHTPETEIKQLK